MPSVKSKHNYVTEKVIYGILFCCKLWYNILDKREGCELHT